MTLNKKKAFIDQIMLGFFLISMVLVFVATVSDELKVRNKHANLKKLVQTAVLSASKYYTNENNDTTEAQNIALGVVEQSKLGAQVKNSIEFTWDFISDPSNVKAKIENYEEDMFWYRLAGWDSFTFDIIEAKANIIASPADELLTIDEVSDFMPFAINNCGQENGIQPGESLSFIYKAYDIYDANESTGFYGLSSDDPDPRDGSQSDFAHFKNEVYDFNRLNTPQYLVDSEQNSIENDAQQLASALAVHTYDDPMDITVALIDCASTKDNIIISNLVPVTMTNIYCGDKTTSDINIDLAFSDQTGDVFDVGVSWVEWEESKDCSQSGLFRIDLDIKIPDEEEVVLEY